MEKPTKRESLMIITVAVLVIFAWICRVVDIPWHGGCNPIRAVIYPMVFIFWGYTLHHRLIHRQVRHFAVNIAALMFLWFMVRTVKYLLPDQFPDLSRYLWYLYYLGMIFIPALALLTALTVGLPETQRLPRKYNLIWFIGAAIFLLVITNDLHQLFFVFPNNGTVWTDKDYHYGIGYYSYVVFIVVCNIAAIVILTRKNRYLKKRKLGLIPCIPLFFLLCYLGVYAFSGNTEWLKFLFGDMTAFTCVMYMVSLELCIRCGLIRSNSGYGDLFQAGSLNAQITDGKGTVCLTGGNAAELTKEQITAAQENDILIDKNTLLRSKPIRFGRVLWQEDLSELTETMDQIKENMEELEERSRIHKNNLEAERTVLTLQEKNRTEDLLHRETAPQIERIDRLLTQYESETDEKTRRRLLASAAVMGAYIKRYGNLLLVSERSETADIADLTRCFEESFINLELMDVECLCTLPSDIILFTKDMMRIYRTFEGILEDGLSGLQHIWVTGREREGLVSISAEFVCDTDLSDHAAEADAFSSESESCRFTFKIRKGGAAE